MVHVVGNSAHKNYIFSIPVDIVHVACPTVWTLSCIASHGSGKQRVTTLFTIIITEA